MEESPFFFTWTAQRDAVPFRLTGGKGCWLEVDGTPWLDLGSLVFQANVGHGHPRMIEAVKSQADRLCLSVPSAVYPEKTELANALLRQATGDFSKVFFCLGGAEANEHALKIARMATGRIKAISRYRSYHGATLGAATLTGDWRRIPVEPGIPGVVHVLDLDSSLPKATAASLIPRTLELEGQVAAVFLEAVVGANGVLIPDRSYFAEVRRACDENGALLVIDEVLTGFGRTGRWFAYEHFEVEPDLVTLGKALTGGYGTLGAVLVHRRVAERFEVNPLVTGLTHYAHPLGVAAALEAMRVYHDEGLIDRASGREKHLQAGLQSLAEGFSFLGAVRSIGLLGAVDCDLHPSDWVALSQAMRRERIHLHVNRRTGAVMVAPPLCIDEGELDEGFHRMRRAFESLTTTTSA